MNQRATLELLTVRQVPHFTEKLELLYQADRHEMLAFKMISSRGCERARRFEYLAYVERWRTDWIGCCHSLHTLFPRACFLASLLPLVIRVQHLLLTASCYSSFAFAVSFPHPRQAQTLPASQRLG